MKWHLPREKSRYEVAYDDYEDYPEAGTAAAAAAEEETATKPDDRNLQNTLHI